MTTHWLAEQMRKGHEGGTVQTLVDPYGTVWSVGDEIFHTNPETLAQSNPTTIKTIYPGHGDEWRPRPPNGDHDAVWFLLSDGWMVRPWLVRKVK